MKSRVDFQDFSQPNWEVPHRNVLYHTDPWTMAVKYFIMNFSFGVSDEIWPKTKLAT